MELISVTLLVLIPFFTILYVYFKYSFQYWKSRGVVHDEPSIPYGNTKGFSTTINQALFVKNVYDKYKPMGEKVAGLYFLSTPVAVLLDINLIKSVMIKDFAHFTDRGLFYNEKDDPISANLFSLDGGPWKKLRAKLSPTFTSGKMKFMFPTVVEVGERFGNCLSKIVQQHDELEIKDLLARFTTDVIGTCAFGIECNSLEDPNAEFRRYGAYTFEKPRHSPGFFILVRGFKKTAKKLHVKSFRDDVSEFFLKVVRDTVDYREKNNVSRNDFMDILIKLKNEEPDDKTKSITFNELAAQAFVFFLAGFETSSTTLTFCLYELALNPDIQEKARKVIREAYEKHNGNFTYEMMMDMPYIDQVLEETLRKYPPIAVLSRTTTLDYRVPGSNLVIEKGLNVLIPAYAIQHDPEYYPDPEKFNPDRFESEETKKPNPMTWLAFGNGPRNCIGLRFGMMQARIGLVTLLNKFEFSLAPGMPVPLVIEKGSLFLSPEGGVRLKVKSVKS